MLDGGAGNDIITAGAGNDFIVGGLGNDTITTGQGADDAMLLWIASFDPVVAAELARKREWGAAYKLTYDKSKKENKLQAANKMPKFEPSIKLVEHQDYFSLQDVRPAAITTKLRNREADAYDFAAHANPSTTHKHYDRRKEKKASPTE